MPTLEWVGSRTFRPGLSLRLLLAGAGLFWVGIFLALLRLPEVRPSAFGGAIGFIGLFALSFGWLSTVRIRVDGDHIEYRGLRRCSLSFAGVTRVEVLPSLALTLYQVSGGGRVFQFTSWFSGHRELLELLLSRCGWRPTAPPRR